MKNSHKFRSVPVLIIGILFIALGSANALDLTNLFFLHHSVGDGMIVEGDMRGVINAYNSTNNTHYGLWDQGYNADGLRNPAGEETGLTYAIPGDNTDPDGLFYLWTSSESNYFACRNRILSNHEVIAFKSSCSASHITDTNTLNTYKDYYRVMRNYFDLYPQKLFVVMSPPPLHRLDTDATEGTNARAFATWLKSSEYLAGHTNLVCFDLFDSLAGTNNFLKLEYEGSSSGSDSYPNTLADETVGPVFARFLIDSANAYHPSVSNISAPQNVSASDGTYFNKVRITWSGVSGASDYLVYRSAISNASSPELIATNTAQYADDTNAVIGHIYYYWIKARDSNSAVSVFSLPDTGWRRMSPATSNAGRDLDGDRIMDPAVYCETNGHWEVLFSSANYFHVQAVMGGPGVLPDLADFDGDFLGDVVLYSAADGKFMVALSTAGYKLFWTAMGGAGFLPEPGDYDGDGLADPAVYSPATGYWRVKLSSANYFEVALVFGGSAYRAVPEDYDGDAKMDPAVCDELTGVFRIKCSSLNYAEIPVTFGSGEGRAVPADYDGDGKADPSFYHAESGLWNVWYSGSGYILVSYNEFGGSGFSPCPGDYDGDGLADPCAYNGETGEWLALFSNSNYDQIEDNMGEQSSIPVGISP